MFGILFQLKDQERTEISWIALPQGLVNFHNFLHTQLSIGPVNVILSGCCHYFISIVILQASYPCTIYFLDAIWLIKCKIVIFLHDILSRCSHFLHKMCVRVQRLKRPASPFPFKQICPKTAQHTQPPQPKQNNSLNKKRNVA